MKIYYYGRREEVIALVDGLLAKEFYPQNLKSYPILRHDEASLFWFPQVFFFVFFLFFFVFFCFFLFFFCFFVFF